MQQNTPTTAHSSAWVFQVKASFAIAATAMGVGIAWLPIDPWKRGFLAVGVLFLVNATFSLSKTLRDEHEATKVHSRIDDYRLGRMLAEHDPFRDPLTGHSSTPAPVGFVATNQPVAAQAGWTPR
jgi:hypothetical protein